MPITLKAISRRRFLVTSVAGAAAVCSVRGAVGKERPADPNRFALLADTHVAGDRLAVARGINMADHLQAVGREILAAEAAPAGVLIGGDCAYTSGTSEDYGVLMDLLRPLREQGSPVHLALGNHDHRERFWQAAGEADRQASLVEEKHVLKVAAPLANWFILDSLDVTNKTPGTLGDHQLKWLAGALDQAADKPALVMVHHNPDEKPKTTGLTDTGRLFEVLLPRRHVKAVFFGHTHVWQTGERDGLHFVNLPPTAYVFSAGKPSAWVDARLTGNGMTLELRCVDAQHPQHGQRVDLNWRA
jgi:3',5'-cyclic AMP phosphodiesterase CpdA